jgi:small subunit ribosomal protein S30e
MGKQHGSLARAGKVKNQTPKAAKKERVKKNVVGRAKKRLTYNKRYLTNPVKPGEKRRGMNPQAVSSKH